MNNNKNIQSMVFFSDAKHDISSKLCSDYENINNISVKLYIFFYNYY